MRHLSSFKYLYNYNKVAEEKACKMSKDCSPPRIAGPSSSKGPNTTAKPKPYCKTRIRNGPDADDETPKPSAATEMLFRVMRQSAQRLNNESKELHNIEELITEALKDCSKEMGIMKSMLRLARQSWNFQIGIDPDEESEMDLENFELEFPLNKEHVDFIIGELRRDIVLEDFKLETDQNASVEVPENGTEGGMATD